MDQHMRAVKRGHRGLKLGRLVLLTALLATISRPPAWADEAAPGPRFVQPPEIAANPNPAAPLAAVVRFAASVPVSTTLEISDGRRTWRIRYPAETVPEQGLPVAGLRPGRRHEIRVTVRDAAGREAAGKTLLFTPPALPAAPGELPALQVTRRGPEEVEPGVTLFSPRRFRGDDPVFANQFGLLVAVDEAGDIVWFYRTNIRISDFLPLRNGHIIYLTTDHRAIEIDLLGNIVRQWFAADRPQGPVAGAIPVKTLTLHHEIEEMPGGNFLVLGSEKRRLENYYTSETDAAAPRKAQEVMGDEILEFTPQGEVVWRWKAFEHLDPYRIGYETFSGYWERRGFPGVLDWSHANGLLYDARDDSLLVNFRYQSAVLKIDRRSGRIRWILGEPSGWPEALRGRLLQPAEGMRWPWHQHSPRPTPQGTLLLYDNANFRARPFDPPTPPARTRSRVVEYAIDEAGRTVREVWSAEIEGDPPVFSTAMGSVQWLPDTGHVLVCEGSLVNPAGLADGSTWETAMQTPGWTRLREYAHTRPARIVWELSVAPEAKDGIDWAAFGASRLSHLGPR